MNLHQLRVFYAVTQHMSFSAAARALFMTQPAVSQQVRALETSLGVRLFDRAANRLALTEAGAALRQSAAAILHAEDEARRAIAEYRDAARAKLIVGANTTGGMYLLPRILRAFRAAHPSVELVLDIDATDQICERIHAMRLDLALVGGPVDDRRLAAEPVVRDEVVMIASADHPLAAGGRLTLAELAEQRLIVAEPRSRTRQQVERQLRQAGLRVLPAMELIGTEAVKKAVEANLGVAFVSAYAIEHEVRDGVLRRLSVEGVCIERPLELIHRSTKYLTPAARQLRQFLRGWVASHLGAAAAVAP